MKKTYQKTKYLLSLLLLTSLISACSDHDDDKDIPLSQVPSAVMASVQNALPGINITEAEMKKSDDNRADRAIYELEGKLLDNKEYEIKMYGDGTIIKIKLDD